MAYKSRILVFIPAFRPMVGGSELALEEVTKRLPDIFFDIVTPRYKKEFEVFEPGNNFNIHRVGFLRNLIKIFFPISGFFKALELLRENKYAAIHAYQASYGGGAAWLLKLFYPRLPFILTLQEGKKLDEQFFLLNWFRCLIISKADFVTVISNYLKEYIERVSKNKKIFLMPNGVDLQKFKIQNPKSPTEDLGPSLRDSRVKINEKIIITVSRLVEKNGVEDLIDAFNILNSRFQISDLELVVIGGGPLERNLKSKVRSLKLEDKVKFIGKISSDEVPKYLAQADVFVRPSLSEGLGTAFLEAMAAGLPIVATSVGGIPDFLTEGETGLFCKVSDPEDIAEKINRILIDDDLRNKLILNGRKLVEEKYSWDKIARKFRELYLEVMNP